MERKIILFEFGLKLIDSMLGTVKNILLIKDRGVLSSVVSGFATFFYMLILVDVRKAAVVGAATAIGGMISFIVFKRFEKDKTWVFDIMPPSHEEGKIFADKAREMNLPIMTYHGFTEDKKINLCSKIYSCSKEHSKLVEELIPEGFSYNIYELKQFTKER